MSGPEEAGLHCTPTDPLTDGRFDHREEVVRDKRVHEQRLQVSKGLYINTGMQLQGAWKLFLYRSETVNVGRGSAKPRSDGVAEPRPKWFGLRGFVDPLNSFVKPATLAAQMMCLIAGVIVGLFLIGVVSKAISGVVYRHYIRVGHADPAGPQLVSFIASFIVILATVVIAGWIFLSSFRFER